MKDKNLQAVLRKVEKEVGSLQREINSKNETLDLTKKINEKLKEYAGYAEYKKKYEDISKQYESEKERLVKLHSIYNEKEEECSKLKQENKEWKDWFSHNKEIFGRLLSVAPPKSVKKTTEATASKDKKKIKIRKKKI